MPHPVILPYGERAREAALRKALSQRARAVWRELGQPLQAQLVIGALGLPALVADHAQRYYASGGGGPDHRAALVPWIVRVVLGLTLGLGFLLARLGPRIFLRAGDEPFLTLTALSPGARFRHRAEQLGLVALPMVWLGAGAVLPLAWNGNAGLLLRGLALWLAWASVAWATCAAVSALAPRQGRGQAVWELGAALLAPALLWGARLASGLVVPLERPDSLWVTAALGALLALLIARTAARTRWLLLRREAALERARAHDDRVRGGVARLRAAAQVRAGRRALPRWARGTLAFVQRNALTAVRSPRVGGPWAFSVLLKALGLALVLTPAATREGRPWALAGAALLLADAVAGGALITQMEYELPHVFFGTPGPRARRWWGAALPHLALSAACALALAGIAVLAPDGGPATARFILGWCGLAGASLVVMATNLAMAAYPETAVAQNLFWIGLLVCLILSSVLPLFGWVILFAFALVSFRQLRHWGPA
jgi:hypothetical protein